MSAEVPSDQQTADPPTDRHGVRSGDPSDVVTATPVGPVRVRVVLPLWFEALLLTAVTGVVCAGGLGLALAIVDRYSAGLSLGIGVPVALVLAAIGTRSLAGRAGERPDRSGSHLPAAVMVVVTAALAGWNAFHAGAWINTDRDPATYAVAAKWLTRHSGLVVDYSTAWAGTGIPLQGEGPSVYDVGGGQLEFQFNHLLAVVLSQAGTLAGDGGLLRGGALLIGLGMLAVYAVGVRLTGRPWIVLVTTLALGLSLPVVYIARSTFSEGITMLLLWAGAWLLLTAWERAPVVLGALGGLCLGASVMSRVDALVYLVALPVLAAVVAAVARDSGVRRRITLLSAAALAGAVVPVAVGTVDIVKRTGRYYADLGPSVKPLQAAAVAALVVGVLGVALSPLLHRGARRVTSALAPRATTIAATLALVAIAGLVLDWTVRPALSAPRGTLPNSTVALVQRAEGLPVDQFRTYSELGMTWIGWYLGAPLLCLAVAGVGLLVARAVRGAGAPAVVLALGGLGTVYYLYDLSNTPDQLFGPRRYVAGLLPLFVLAAAAALALLFDLLRRVERGAPAGAHERPTDGELESARPRRLAVPVVGALLAVLLVFQVSTLWRVRAMSPRSGLLATVDRVCDRIGPDAAVLFAYPDYGFVTYPPTLRSWCDVPAVGTVAGPTTEQVRHAAEVLAGRGRTLWLLDDKPDNLAKAYGADAVVDLGTVYNRFDPGVSITRPPTSYSVWTTAWYGVEISV